MLQTNFVKNMKKIFCSKISKKNCIWNNVKDTEEEIKSMVHVLFIPYYEV